jgi:protocatechuate 3,4-dioxygenase beta subunit
MTAYVAYQQYKDQPRTTATAPAGKLPPTTGDIEGPFYKAGAPIIESSVLAEDGNLIVSGFVRNQDGEALDAVLDVWQADAHGDYDEKRFHLRGKIRCLSDAGYAFKTARPGDYKIADDPPDFRCAHIHVKVTADEFKPLTTQLYFPKDPYNATDHWFSQDRVIQINEILRPGEGRFDFVLERIEGT